MSKEAGQVAYERLSEALGQRLYSVPWNRAAPEVKAAWATVERLAAEKAWNDGYCQGRKDEHWDVAGTVNPYRIEPAKGDGGGE